MAHKRIFSIFVIAFLISGFYFFTIPDTAYSGVVPNPVPPCCQDSVGGSCFGGDGASEACESEQCMINDCDFFEDRICVEQNGAGVCVAEPQDVPAMNKWGFVALAAVLAVIGFIAVRRRIIKA